MECKHKIKFNSATDNYYCDICGKVFDFCDVCENKNSIICNDCSENQNLIYRFEFKGD